MKDNDQLSALERLHRKYAPEDYMSSTQRLEAVLDRLNKTHERQIARDQRLADFDKKNGQ